MSSAFDPNTQRISTTAKIVTALERISEAFRVLLWNQSKAYGLSPLQVQVLIFLHYHTVDKCTVSYLAHEFNMAKPTISDTVKILEGKALITKDPSPVDTRSFVIRLTAKGEQLAAQVSGFSKPVQKPLDQLTSEQREQLLSSLLAVIRHLNAAGIITVQRMCFNCAHYRKHPNGGHYCNLLQKQLAPSELRIDCEEHQAA
ncbi:MAG: hypothetical protein Kow0075_08790 [Salibacteraceae bacterium]